MCIDKMLVVVCCTLLLPFVGAHAERTNYTSKVRVLPLKDEENSQKLLENEMFWKRFVLETSISPRPSPLPTNRQGPTARPSAAPLPPSAAPTSRPTARPSAAPTSRPTARPSAAPLPPSAAPTSRPTARPSAAPLPPTAAPTSRPSEAPISRGTAKPTLRPTRRPEAMVMTVVPKALPSIPPTNTPSSRPSNMPTMRPKTTAPTAPIMPGPTATPTASPVRRSLAPTNEACNVSATIQCTTANGQDCSQLGYPQGMCSVEAGIDVLGFRYVVRLCNESINEQGTSTSCTDNEPFPTGDEMVAVQCLSGDGGTLNVVPGMVAPDTLFTVSSQDGSPLSSGIDCSITYEGVVVQEVGIATSVDVPLSPQNTFGALTVVSCDELSCLVTISYFYNVTNAGTSEMEITVIDRWYNGKEFNLLPFLPANPLAPAQSTSVQETTIIDVCQAGSYRIELLVDASPAEGGPGCRANETYEFQIKNPTSAPSVAPTSPFIVPSPALSHAPSIAPTTARTASPSASALAKPTTMPSAIQLPPAFPSAAKTVVPTATLSPTTNPNTTACNLEAVIECSVVQSADEDGGSCLSLKPPTKSQCLGGNPKQLRFVYTGRLCSFSNSTNDAFKCRDIAGGPSSIAALVRITNSQRNQTFYSKEAPAGEIIVVTNPSGLLPDLLKIEIMEPKNGDNTTVQTMDFPAKCDATNNMRLLTSYGVLQLTAFENGALGYNSAIEVIKQSFLVRNAGRFPAIIEWANSTSTMYGNSVLVSPPGYPIERGQEISFGFAPTSIDLYASIGATFNNSLVVSGYGVSSGLACQSSTSLDIVIGA